MSKDVRAVYDPRIESVRTGDGQFISLIELKRALSTLNPIKMRRVIKRAGLEQGVTDPMEEGRGETIEDILSICRGLPQYTMQLVDAAMSFPELKTAFEGTLRNRRFGSSELREPAAGPAYVRPARPPHSGKVSDFFWNTRNDEGEFSFFVRVDRKTLTLRAGQRLSSTRPYEESFLVMRTAQGRYFLRWPDEAGHVPAYYLDVDSNAIHFYPRPVGREAVEFEELFPGYTYEVFGLQFSLPDIGTDYRMLDDDLFPDDVVKETQEAEGAEDRKEALLLLLEADPDLIGDIRALSKHFRVISVKYHPLKHLHAPEDEKKRINDKYLEITNAYNELKKYYQG